MLLPTSDHQAVAAHALHRPVDDLPREVEARPRQARPRLPQRAGARAASPVQPRRAFGEHGAGTGLGAAWGMEVIEG